MGKVYLTKSGGGGGSAAMWGEIDKKVGFTKLWENPSPDSTFAAQSVCVDDPKLSECIGVFVRYKSIYSGTGYYVSGFIPVGKLAILQVVASDGNVRQRVVQTKSTGIIFNEGQQGGTNSASYCVPTEIYGVMGAFA